MNNDLSEGLYTTFMVLRDPRKRPSGMKKLRLTFLQVKVFKDFKETMNVGGCE
ncbi:MAG: hypothetical protein QXU18_05390 [Thermoplasmatales archaeon]